MADIKMDAVRSLSIDLVYWKDAKASAAVLSAGLLAFYLVASLSVITALCYGVALTLTLRLGYYVAEPYLVRAKVTEARPPPVIPDEWLSAEETQVYVAQLTAAVNSAARLAFSLLYCESKPLVYKTVAACGAVGYIARIFGTSGLLLLAYLAAFSVPKVYELKQAEIDAVLVQLQSKADELYTLALGKLPASGPDEKKKL